MRRVSLTASALIAAFGLGALCTSRLHPGVAREKFTLTPGTAVAYFSPDGGCTDAVVAALGRAKTSIYVQAYSFTSAPIAEALVAAFRRGVKVEIILDKSQRKATYSSADFVSRANIPTFIDAKHAIAHNKVMIIDGKELITGSFNFTKAAEGSNAENLLIIHDPELAACYLENWKVHREHSQAYARR